MGKTYEYETSDGLAREHTGDIYIARNRREAIEDALQTCEEYGYSHMILYEVDGGVHTKFASW